VSLGRPSLARAILFATTAIVSVFAVASVLESTLLGNADQASVDLFHAARGIASSTVAALAVVWALQRTGSPLARGTGGSLDPEEKELNPLELARWIIRMRWVACAVMGAMVAGAARVRGLLADGALVPLVVVVVLTPALNLLYLALLRRMRSARVGLLLQVVGDLVLLTAALHYSGGVGNPLVALMALHVAIAGIVLTARECYAVAGAAIALSAGLGWAEAVGLATHHPLGLWPNAGQRTLALQPTYVALWSVAQAATLVGIAHFSVTLSENARRARQTLLSVAEGAMAQKSLLEHALETTGTGLRLIGPDLAPTWESSRWREWFGGSARASAPSLAVVRVFEDRAVRVSEISVPEPDPARPGRMRTRSFEITTAPVIGAGDGGRQVVELATDVTDKKRAQAELVRTGKLVAVGELAAVVAHEINNPIAILGAKAQLLLTSHHQEMSPKVQRELQKIVELSERVASIAQGLLSACRPARGARKRMDLRAPIRRVLGMIDAEREKRGVEVDDRLEEPLPVLGNPSELEQVFLNLILNALHAMPNGGKLSVVRCPEAAAGDVAVAVEDTGAGIPREHLDRVFEPFFSTKGEGHGTGLGLSVCLSVVQAHGGRIDIDSEEGKWTRVLVTLPRAAETEEVRGAEAAHLGSG